MGELKDQVLSGLRWQAGAKVGSQIVSWGITIFVIRLLSPSDYGLMAMAMVLVGLAGLVGDMGFGAALVRGKIVSTDFKSVVFGASLAVNLILYIALLAATPVAAWMFRSENVSLLIAILGMQFPIIALGTVPEAMARREMKFRELSLIELLTQLSSALTTLFCAMFGLGVWALVAGQVMQALVRSTALIVRFGCPAPFFNFGQHRELLGFGTSLTLNRAIWYFASQADVFLVGKVLGAQLLGIYSVALNLANLPMQKFMSIANQVAYSGFAKLQDEKERFSKVLTETIWISFSAATGALWLVAAVAPEFIPILLGAKWDDAVTPFQIMAMSIPIRLVCGIISTALIAGGFVKDDLYNTIIGSAILVPSFYIGASFAGLTGVALGWGVGFPIFAMILVLRACSRFEISPTSVFAIGIRPLVSAALSLLAVHYLRQQFADLQSVSRLIILIVAGTSVFVFVQLLLDDRMRSLIRSKLAGLPVEIKL